MTVEFEIAYVLGRDVQPDESAFPVMNAVAEVRVAFELVLSRFTDCRTVGWPSFAADNAGFQTLILGDRIDPDQVPDLVRSLVVSADSQEAARSLSRDDATDPEAALADLGATARERSMVLLRGSAGTVSKPFNVTVHPAEISARFLGVELGFRIEVG